MLENTDSFQAALNETESAPLETPFVEPPKVGASFDISETRETHAFLAGLKRMQDPAKYSKARFSFRLYRK